jgi:hypothetical protein
MQAISALTPGNKLHICITSSLCTCYGHTLVRQLENLNLILSSPLVTEDPLRKLAIKLDSLGLKTLGRHLRRNPHRAGFSQ